MLNDESKGRSKAEMYSLNRSACIVSYVAFLMCYTKMKNVKNKHRSNDDVKSVFCFMPLMSAFVSSSDALKNHGYLGIGRFSQ